MKKGGSLIAIGIISLLFTSIYSGYLFYKKNDIEKKLVIINDELLVAEDNLLQYESNNVFDAVNANRAFEDLSGTVINWSNVIMEVNKLIPKDSIEVLSYSFSGNNSVSIGVRTIGNQNPYVAVANLIRVIDESKYFVGIFVPSVSEGLDAKGHETVSFSFTIQYLPDGSGALKNNFDAWDVDSVDIGEFDDGFSVKRDVPTIEFDEDEKVIAR